MNVRKTTAGSSAHGSVATTFPRLPFGDGNAASQWHPAMKQINAYAQKLGIGSISYEGTGVKARGMPQPVPVVQAIEKQKIILTSKDGKKHDLGEIMPQGEQHMTEIKSTAELVAEMKELITKFGQR